MVLWLGSLSQLSQMTDTDQADAILVDASHEEGDVYHDLMLSVCLLKRNGLLFVHDYEEPAHTGVKAAVDRFLLNTSFQSIGQHWTMLVLQAKTI